jgi:hypothetical protein
MTLGVDTQLGPYRIVAPLGTGGMWEVYKAREQHEHPRRAVIGRTHAASFCDWGHASELVEEIEDEDMARAHAKPVIGHTATRAVRWAFLPGNTSCEIIRLSENL